MQRIQSRPKKNSSGPWLISAEPLSQEEIEVFSAVKEIHKENGFIWLMATRDMMTLKEECQAEYEALYNATEDIINNHMKFYAPAEWEGFEEESVVSFETVDLDGNPVKSEDLFSKNKVTMINLWGTYCGPCITEMPKIEKIYQEFASKGGGVIGTPVLGAQITVYPKEMEALLSEAE